MRLAIIMGKEKRAFERTKKSIQRATNVALDAAYEARRGNSSHRTLARTYRGTMSRGSGGAPVKAHALALLVASMALLVTGGNGQTPAPDASGGSYVDVSSNANAEVEGRFGTQPSQRSGQSLVRPVPGYTPIRRPPLHRPATSRNEHTTVSFSGTSDRIRPSRLHF